MKIWVISELSKGINIHNLALYEGERFPPSSIGASVPLSDNGQRIAEVGLLYPSDCAFV